MSAYRVDQNKQALVSRWVPQKSTYRPKCIRTGSSKMHNASPSGPQTMNALYYSTQTYQHDRINKGNISVKGFLEIRAVLREIWAIIWTLRLLQQAGKPKKKNSRILDRRKSGYISQFMWPYDIYWLTRDIKAPAYLVKVLVHIRRGSEKMFNRQIRPTLRPVILGLFSTKIAHFPTHRT